MKEKGKNFSCNNLGQRRKGDYYPTHYSLTRQFLDAHFLNMNKSILEPCCGNGAIVKVLKEYFSEKSEITSYDLSEGKDFLQETGQYDWIVTNPPFSIAQEFILHAKKVCKRGFAFLLPLSYLHGKKRFDTIYSDTEFPITHVYVFTHYPMLGAEIREDGKYKTGMMVYAWFVWQKDWSSIHPRIHWLDNNDYVLKKGE